DHPRRPALRRAWPGARGARAWHEALADPPACGRAAGDPDRHPADRQRVHHAPQADEPRLGHLGPRAADGGSGAGVGQVQLPGDLRRGAGLLPRDRERPHVPPEPARAAVHVPLAGAPRTGCSRGTGEPRRTMTDAVLRAEEVEKAYDDLKVLAGVSLEVARGQVKVIIGPSGSGKSTFLRCLALLEPVDGGAVYLEDERLSDRKEKELAAHRCEIGMVFQRFNLFQNMTALRNVTTALVDVRRLPKREARDQAREFLDRVGLADKAGNYPEELSGGQQQRVAIARALVMRPKAMLFDEPTSALDVELVREVLDV